MTQKIKVMKNRIKIYLLIILTLSIFNNCQKDWLEVTPYGIYSGSEYVKDDASALQLLNGVYANFLGRDMNWPYWVVGDCMSDDAEAGGEGTHNDTPEFQEYTEFRSSTAGAQMENFWRYSYSGIYRANATISILEDLELPEEDLSTELKDRLIAEAKFLKTKFHFNLLKIFGPIPYIPELFADVGEYRNIPRTPIAEILHNIQDDLTDIYDILPGRFSSSFDYKYESAADNGRPGKDAARAFLIKMLVFESSYNELAENGKDPNNLYEGCENKWDQVRQLADDMIENEDLYGVGLEPDWASLWRVAGENSDEIIWKLNHSATERIGANLPGNSTTDEYWNVATDDVMLQTFRDGIMLYDSSDLADYGWGWNCPTQYFVDMFDRDDPRFKLTVIEDGDTVEVVRSTEEPDLFKRLAIALPSSESPTGMNHRKCERNRYEYNGTRAENGPLDTKVIRYADVLLWAAEAHLKPGGDPSKALEYVNRIRERARNITSPPSAVPADLTSITLEQLYNERRRELAFEAHRFFDLVRWGIAAEKLDGMQVRGGDYTISFVEGVHEYLPIPELAITESDGLIYQNNGY
jgi:hypothetical protein